MLVPGRTLAVAVYRPLAEQLAELAAPAPGDHVLELSAGDGELTTRLRHAVGTDGVVDVALRRATAADGVVDVALLPWNLAATAPGCDLAVSLLAIESRDELTMAMEELTHIARRALVAVWADGATHDTALRSAWREVTGADLDALPPAAPPIELPTGWQQRRLSDVARFDGVEQLLTALTSERGIDVPDHQRAALRDRLAHHVAPFTAADGTMRIPVHATLLERR